MFEQSKAAKRRFDDGNFHNRYFVGTGIDIGCGNDNLGNLKHVFRGIESVRPWDIPDGDAQFLNIIPDNTFDFAVSSHCLEHMVQPHIAIQNWIRVVKPGGYIIITIPDEEMYEHDMWPSAFNSDHKWSFTLRYNDGIPEVGRTVMPNTINVLKMCQIINDFATVEKIEVIRDFYYEDRERTADQTLHPCIECAIEIVLKKL